MSTELSPSYSREIAIPQMRTRVASIAVLIATAAGLVWLGFTIFHVITDAWVGPLHLSPDNDKVIQLRLRFERQKSELARVEAEITRIDGELDGIDDAIERLSALRGQSNDSMTWEANVRAEEAQRLDRIVANLRAQRSVLQRLVERQEQFTREARENLEAGLIQKSELEKQEQSLDSLHLSLVENQRKLEEAKMRRRQTEVESDAFHAGIGAAVGDTDPPGGRMPQVAAGEEHEMRIELEIIRLQAERRGLLAVRAAARERLEEESRLLEEIEDRPLYRAMHSSTYVAFVPYDQMGQVVPGARVMACTWSLFNCSEVGRVKELLPGEVATEDPWGELARGQFAILDLDEEDAIEEKVLRIRSQ